MVKNPPASAGGIGLPGPEHSIGCGAPKPMCPVLKLTHSRAHVHREAVAMGGLCTAAGEQSLLSATRRKLCSSEDPANSKTKINATEMMATGIFRVFKFAFCFLNKIICTSKKTLPWLRFSPGTVGELGLQS